MALPVPPCAEAKSLYGHSPVHLAVFERDHVGLRRILLSLSRPPVAGSIRTEAESVAAEKRALETSAVIDRRDVPGKETALCLAVRLKDPVAVEMLMLAGADVSLQNFGGWTPLQEAVCMRDEGLTAIMLRHYQVIAWAKYMRRLPALAAVMHRMRDFYMELTWQFESAVVPFIARIAPSDTYRIWKAGSCLRADMTLAGFDGLRIKRKAQSLLFYGKGTPDGRVKAGTLVMLNHEKKETFDALEGAGGEPSDAELAQDVRSFFQTNVYRAGIDVSSAKVVPITSWRGNVRTEMVSSYKTKVHEVQNVHLRFKSRRVPGALTDEELFGAKGKKGGEGKEKGGKGEGGRSKESEDDDGLGLDEESQRHLDDVLTEEERRQLDAAMLMREEDVEEDGEGGRRASSRSSEDEELLKMQHLSPDDSASESSAAGKGRSRWSPWRRASGSGDADGGGGEKEKAPEKEGKQDKKGWRGGKKGGKEEDSDGKQAKGEAGAMKGELDVDGEEERRLSKTGEGLKDEEGVEKAADGVEKKEDNEMRRGVKPMLWLTEDFPLEMQELMPLLDLMANKVKAVMRVKELLMTKIPSGTVPVKIAIPIIPTIRVSVTFSKFVEHHGARPPSAEDNEAKPAGSGGGEDEDDEFHTPTGSPERDGGDGGKKGSWFGWRRGRKAASQDELNAEGGSASVEEQSRWLEDPFEIPKDYEWIDLKERKRREREKRKKAKAKAKAKSSPTEASSSASGAAKERAVDGGSKGGGVSSSGSQFKENGVP